MKIKFWQSMSKSVLCLRFVQACILLTALIFWACMRGNAYQVFYAPEDLILISAEAMAGDVVLIDEASGGVEGPFLRTPEQALSKGSYQITVYYSARGGENKLSVSTEQIDSALFYFNELSLDPECRVLSARIDVPRDVDDLALNLSFSGVGSLEIAGIGLAETSGRYKKNCFYALLVCLLLELGYRFKRSDPSGRAIMMALTGVFVVSCCPLYSDFLTVGNDIPYHILRIEGIAEGLSEGMFPVKIYPVWAKDYGYAVGVMYGDILLYFPAFLRLLGFSIQTAYKFYLAAVNLGTVLLSYYAFKKIFGSRRIGVAGSLIYMLSNYRLVNLYTRSAVGEYSAMMFLPLIFFAFYQIFTATDKKNWWKHGIVTAFSLTGLVQTHILSCEMAAFVILLFCLILLPKVFRKYTFMALLEGAFLTIAINIGFLVPFLEFYGSGLVISETNWNDGPLFFQSMGIFPMQLFSIFQKSTGGSWPTKMGIYSEATYGLGILSLIVILLFCYMCACHYTTCREHPHFKAGLLCTVLGCLLAYMSTCYFPWDSIAASGKIAAKLIGTLQFPWRLLEMATVLLTFTGCFVFSMLPKLIDRTKAWAVVTGMLVLMAVNIGWYLYDLMYASPLPYRVYDTCELYTMALYSYEYLPEDMDPEMIERDLILRENVEVVNYSKRGTHIECDVVAEQADGYVDFPLIGYDHYVCVSVDTGQSFPVEVGFNHMLRVRFPETFEGRIQIDFREPWYWRLSEVVSVVIAGTCALLVWLQKRKSHQKI